MKQNTTAIGARAERRVAYAFRRSGFQVLDHNWRQKTCEIDLVVCRDSLLYFVEVRYRSHADYGYGYDTISARKLHKMYYGAQLWVEQHNWQNEYRVLVASVSDNAITILAAE